MHWQDRVQYSGASDRTQTPVPFFNYRSLFVSRFSFITTTLIRKVFIIKVFLFKRDLQVCSWHLLYMLYLTLASAPALQVPLPLTPSSQNANLPSTTLRSLSLIKIQKKDTSTNNIPNTALLIYLYQTRALTMLYIRAVFLFALTERRL